MVQVSQSATATVTVTESNIAKTMKSGSLEVFATPAMCALMEEAAQADRIIIMDRGKIAADGSPVEIFQEVDKLRELSLDVPLEVKLRYRLEKRGIEIPKEVIDRESMVKFLCQYM